MFWSSFEKLVADLTRALHEGCEGRLPVTVKCRIGTDSEYGLTKPSYEEMDPEEEYSKLCRFIETVAGDGIVSDFSVHARIAVLGKSFSPADNRKIPPLKYDVVRRLVKDFPQLTFTLNGGINSLPQALSEFDDCPDMKGIMIGRAWAADPWSFAMTDEVLYGAKPVAENRLQVLQAFGKHADREESVWDPVKIRVFLSRLSAHCLLESPELSVIELLCFG
jgi:tRNA-dihydrouridine synthase A